MAASSSTFTAETPNINYDLHVADHPIGLDEKLKDFEKTVLSQQQQSGKPQILGIVGLGGMGKTTLAKEFFNKKKSKYHKSCFLPDVRDNAGSLNSLQRKLLKSLTSIDVPIENVEQGKLLLKEHLDEGKRMSKQHLNSSNAPENVDHAFNVLIVLDDIDNVNQVDALLPFDLSSGSLILIICRDKDLLVGPNGESSLIYVLTALDYQQSIELMHYHVFGQTYPLPRTSPTDRIENNYKALDPEEKEMVLDLACFLEGLKKTTAISIWKESSWTIRYELNGIQNAGLAKVDSFNRIHIPDDVKGMGRIVAEESSPRRIWRWTEKVKEDLLQQSSVITARGIKMDLSEYNAYGGLLRNIDTSSLRIIDTEGFVLERILKGAELPSLLWLRWVDCPYSSLPSWIPIKNLRYLELSGSLLNTLWVGESESQVHLQFPKYVEELNLNNCVKLKNITGWEQFTYLRRLSVSGCSELEELPSMEPFVFFEELCATGCVKLKSLRESRTATRLRVLDISGCSELEELPSMEIFVCLEKLLAAGCVKLKNLPELGKPTRLRLLDISGCSELEELPSMEACEYLEELLAAGCVKLKNLPELGKPTRLRVLDISGCSELEELSSMEACVYLEELLAAGCVKLKNLTELGKATTLRVLDISGCSELEELPSMEAFVYLKELLAAGCVKLKNLPELGKARTLRVLDISGCSELKGLPCMGYWQVESQCVWSLLGLPFQKGSKVLKRRNFHN